MRCPSSAPQEGVFFRWLAGRAAHRMYQHFGRATEWYTPRRSAGVMGMEEFYLFSGNSVG